MVEFVVLKTVVAKRKTVVGERWSIYPKRNRFRKRYAGFGERG